MLYQWANIQPVKRWKLGNRAWKARQGVTEKIKMLEGTEIANRFRKVFEFVTKLSVMEKIWRVKMLVAVEIVDCFCFNLLKVGETEILEGWEIANRFWKLLKIVGWEIKMLEGWEISNRFWQCIEYIVGNVEKLKGWEIANRFWKSIKMVTINKILEGWEIARMSV